jgi:hypothetical protein
MRLWCCRRLRKEEGQIWWGEFDTYPPRGCCFPSTTSRDHLLGLCALKINTTEFFIRTNQNERVDSVLLGGGGCKALVVSVPAGDFLIGCGVIFKEFE